MTDNRSRDRKYNPNRQSRGGDTKATEIVSGQNKGPGESIQAVPLQIIVYGNQFERALRTFRALVQKERTISLYKEKQSYEKPSDKKRRKKGESARRRMELENVDKDFDTKRKPKKSWKPRREENNQE
jgi:small subunit ribosomal protein S21